MGKRIGRDARLGWIGPWSAWRRDIAAAALIGLLLGATGPFGSFLNGGLGARLAYWVATSLLALAVYGLGLRWALHEGHKRGQPEWFVLAVGVVVLSIPYSLAISFGATAVWPAVRRHVHGFDWYWQALVLSVPISLAWQWSRRRGAGPHNRPGETEPPADAAADPRRLAAMASGPRLICLQMEDHYVRVHTEAGSTLVLSSLAAAVDAFAGLEGARVHRSWWVARDQVVRPIWAGRKLQLELTNGVRAPVSRSRVAKLKAVGWLEQG